MESPYQNQGMAYLTEADFISMSSEGFTRFPQPAPRRNCDYETHLDARFSNFNKMPLNYHKEFRENNTMIYSRTLVATLMSSKEYRNQPSNLNKYPEAQRIKNPTRDMEILAHVKNDIITFVEMVMKKVNNEKQSKAWLPAPQYIDYFQKIKYAFNLLGEISSCLEVFYVRGLVYNLFQSLEYVIYYCPDYKNLPRQVNCPLLTDNAVMLLSIHLGQNQINYLEELVWTITRPSWPEPKPPAYIPTFYDGWQLPEIIPLESDKDSAQALGTSKNSKF